ncbi:acetyltransferase GNAT family protein [Asticcacaulis biprosthecium C19]|uniref:Acetyltransferase GNAT family protein n=1 Tax=Asticcacaulis biprosthecium C19 TaxID=715226 RepID=F4QU68_9CAUL|nr:N-acetyltransferase [Asticcacaulis biprosthecium]EGF89368.1 acetyltransferase GNAT family protein [Asticcacaulis biprosthecium C19]
MQILPVQSGDIARLSALARDCFSETFGHLYPPSDLEAFLVKSYSAEALLADITDPSQYWRMVIDDAGHTAAYLHCGPVTLPFDEADGNRHGELKRIYVRASHQGLGLGKRLLETALNWMSRTYGDAPQWLGVWSGNDRAQAIYAGYGFEKVGEYKFAVGETLDDEFILRRLPG